MCKACVEYKSLKKLYVGENVWPSIIILKSGNENWIKKYAHLGTYRVINCSLFLLRYARNV